MNYRTLLPNLKYRRLVKAPRRHYHVLEGEKCYVVFSTKNDEAGNYSIVPKRAVKYLVKRVGGKQFKSTAEVFKMCKGSMFFPNRFSVLNAMYALIGVNGAKIRKQEGNKLFFNIRK